MRTSRRVFCAALVMALAAVATAGAADPKFLPNDTELALTINVKQILDSPLLKAHQEAVNQGKKELENQLDDNPAMQIIKKSGFDLFRDLDSVTVTSNGSKDPTSLIVEGKFNNEKFTAAAEDWAKENPNTLAISKAGGQALYEITPPGEKTVYASLIEEKTFIVTSTREALTDALGRLAGTKKTSLKKEFALLLNTTNAKQSLSLVSTGAALSKLALNAPIPNVEAAGSALNGIDGLAASITIAKNIDFHLGLNAKNEEAAKMMAKDWNGLIPFVQVIIDGQAQRDEKYAPLSDVVKTLTVTNQGSNVLLKGTVSFVVMETLLKNLP